MNRDELLRVATEIHASNHWGHKESVDRAASLIAEVDKRCGEEDSGPEEVSDER